MSTSESVAYLREPITQPYLKKLGGEYALVDVENDISAYSTYKELSDDAFLGIPSKHPEVVRNIRKFSIFSRRQRNLLIKEVNPKAAKFYSTQYQSKIILILRHPAAVALSFSQQGWLDSPDVQMDTGDPQATPWEKFGYAYGLTMKNTLDFLRQHADYEVIEYEKLALDPEKEFEKLFLLLKIEMPSNYEEVIRKYCYSRQNVRNAGAIQRFSKDMVDKWKSQLSIQEILLLKKGYYLSNQTSFVDESDWVIN